MKLLYHFSYSFADDFSPEIASRIMGKPCPSINIYKLKRKISRRLLIKAGLKKWVPKKPKRENGVLALGSIMQTGLPGDAVWGTGVHIKHGMSLPKKMSLDIRAVRGPLTRKFVEDHLEIHCPEVYGDPGILFADLFPEFQRKNLGQQVVLAQHNDEVLLAEQSDKYGKYPLFLGQRKGRAWQEFVTQIAQASHVVSSSLHGLILADSFGVPSTWWHDPSMPSASREGRHKFNDYYLSTGRDPDHFSESLDEALAGNKMQPLPDLTQLKKGLIDAFPRDLLG